MWIASHFLNNHVGRHILWLWKRLCLMQANKLNPLKQQRKWRRRLLKLPKLNWELSTGLLKPGKIVVNHHLRGRCGRKKKSWIIKIRDHWNVLCNQIIKKKSPVELKALFNNESKSISTHTMWSELKALGLNSCADWRKQLISETNQKKKC